MLKTELWKSEEVLSVVKSKLDGNIEHMKRPRMHTAILKATFGSKVKNVHLKIRSQSFVAHRTPKIDDCRVSCSLAIWGVFRIFGSAHGSAKPHFERGTRVCRGSEEVSVLSRSVKVGWRY
jgi:hypothetical protein